MKIDNTFIKDNTLLVETLLYRRHVPENDLPDLVQDVFEKALLYQDYYDETQGSAQTWLGLLVVHVYDRYLRTLQPTVALDTDEDSECMYVTEEDLLRQTNDYFYNANKEEVDYYMNLLPEGQRDKLYLHLILGYTHKEVADKLMITENSSKVMCSVAMKNLRALVDSDAPEEVELHEAKVLKPYGDRAYSGDWAWRPNESPDRRNSPVKIFTPEEVQEYCRERNLTSIYD